MGKEKLWYADVFAMIWPFENVEPAGRMVHLTELREVTLRQLDACA
jgi:hypothetical protein